MTGLIVALFCELINYFLTRGSLHLKYDGFPLSKSWFRS